MWLLAGPSVTLWLVFQYPVTYNVRVLNNSQLVVILIGRLMHMCSTLVSQIQELAHKKTPEEVFSSWTVDRTKLSCLILLLHCTAIAGYDTLVIAT